LGFYLNIVNLASINHLIIF